MKFFTILEIPKLLKIMVARDGIEPPTPAFSAPLTVTQKSCGVNAISFMIKHL